MKFLNIKSQAALEYLQNYGFAILLVVIMGVALWQLGVFNAAPKANVVNGFNEIRILEPSIKYIYKPDSGNPDERVTNTLNFTIINTNAGFIRDLNIGVEGDCLPKVLGCTGTSFDKTILGPSETASIGHICCNTRPSGSSFWVKVNITYTQRVGERKVTHTEKGVIQGIVE